jgi:hypothetical protein
MRIITSVAVALVVLAPRGAAQTGDQARIAFTVSAGYVMSRDLWNVDRQPVAALGNCPIVRPELWVENRKPAAARAYGEMNDLLATR